MSDKQNDTGINKVENKIQKKSEKDRNGVIGGLVIGGISIFVAYQIYIKLFEFPIGKMLVYIVVFWAIICFAVAVSCFFDLKESKRIEKLNEEARNEEREFAEIDPKNKDLRAEKMFPVFYIFSSLPQI